MSEELHQQELNDSNNAAPALPGVNLTPKALDAVRKMIAKEGLSADQGLRISVVGGGCSGFQYSLGFDGRKEGDTLTVLDGVNVFIDEDLAALYCRHHARLRRRPAQRRLPLRQSARQPHLRMRFVV